MDIIAPHIVESMTYKLEVQKPRREGPAPREIITKERVVELLGRGLSGGDIAEILGVSRTSLSRHMTRLGVAPRPKGRPKAVSKKEYDTQAAETLVKRLATDSQSFIDDVVEILSRTELPWRELTKEQSDHDWQLLLNAPTRVEGGTITSVTKGGTQFCAQFFPYIYDAKYRSYPSIREAWYDTEMVRKAVRFQIRVGDPVTPVRVFRALRAVIRAPTNFRPCFAKALTEAYCPENGLVLDPCAGYGGRACGVVAAGRSYVGVDPHPRAPEAFKALGEALGKPLVFYASPFEDVNLSGVMADMILTSPPYFSVERYSNDASQSWVRYKSWPAWAEGFLQPFVDKCWAHLKANGVLCVNTKNVRIRQQIYPIATELCQRALERGFHLDHQLQLPIGRIGKLAQTEPVFVFRKVVSQQR